MQMFVGVFTMYAIGSLMMAIDRTATYGFSAAMS